MFTNPDITLIDDFGDWTSNLYADLKKIDVKIMPIDEFLTIPTIANNRDVHRRKTRIAKILRQQGMYEHLNVIIGKTPSGERYIINANTRKQIWLEDLSDKPNFVFAQIRYYNNVEEMKKEYYAIDSQNSVENASDKFTGAFNALHLNLQSKLQRGGITNAIKDFMRAWPDNHIPKTPKNSDFYIETTELLKDELLKLDSILYNLENDRSTDSSCMRQSNFKVVALSFLKKYGIHNDRVIEGIIKLFSGNQDVVYWDGKKQLSDGVSHILYELRNIDSRWLPKGATRSESIEQLDFLFHCFQKFMDNEEMVNAHMYERENSPYLNFFIENELEGNAVVLER